MIYDSIIYPTKSSGELLNHRKKLAKTCEVSKIIPIFVNGSEFVLAEKQGIKSNDFRKIKTVIDENADIIIKRWNEYFNK